MGNQPAGIKQLSCETASIARSFLGSCGQIYAARIGLLYQKYDLSEE
jgi:hypothetical protein